MKRVMLFLSIVMLLVLSCSRQDVISSTPATLEGNWRMIVVKDNSSGLITTKLSDVQGNVDITFTEMNDTSGTVYGHTPSNQISQSDYSVGANHQLRIPFLNITKVWETSWGSEFVNNIRSAREYNIDSAGKLVI